MHAPTIHVITVRVLPYWKADTHVHARMDTLGLTASKALTTAEARLVQTEEHAQMAILDTHAPVLPATLGPTVTIALMTVKARLA